MAQIANTSLFDYLRKPAGIELGTAVYRAARTARAPIAIREVTTRKYRGKVVLYTQEFLDQYFKASTSLQSTKNTYMNEKTINSLAISGTAGYSGTINGGSTITTISTGSGLTLQGNSTINYSHSNLTQNNMKPTQVKVAVFTITRDKDTNEINSSNFLKEFWVEQKNGVSIDLVVAKQLDKDFDPETTIIKVLSTVSF